MLEIAVWGSLLSSFILGIFMGTQSWLDSQRRAPYLIFSMCWLSLTLIDASLNFLGPYYELFRVLWCGFYIASLLHLFHKSLIWSFVLGVGIPCISCLTLVFNLPQFATTVSFVAVFTTAAIVHGQAYFKHQGYASCILMTYMFAQAILCLTYPFVIHGGEIAQIQAGYLHYSFLSVLALMLGWIHLPRELSGSLPVKTLKKIAYTHFVFIVIAEIIIFISLVFYTKYTIIGLSVSSLFILGASSWVYFIHRHRLIIHTDNIELLLAERTGSLQQARKELAHQNEIQAVRLEQQAQELNAKAEIIGRQRRLELAGQTAGGVAHDLANFIHILDRHLVKMEVQIDKNGLQDNMSDDLNMIKRQVKRLYELNQQLLSMSRRGSTQMELIEATTLCTDVKDLLQGYTLSVIDPPSGLLIKGNRSQLLRALANLCINAFEADKSNNVSLKLELKKFDTVQECHLGFLKRGSYVTFEVKDQGPGISKEILDHIFEPFYSHQHGGKLKAGTGLGLAIVAGIIDDHHGTIDLINHHIGCSFTIYLPQLEHKQESLLHNGTLLVTLCNNPELKTMFLELRQMGYRVKSFLNHQRAISSISGDRPFALLYDPMHLSQIEIIQWINLWPDIKFIQIGYIESSENNPFMPPSHQFDHHVQLKDILEVLQETT